MMSRSSASWISVESGEEPTVATEGQSVELSVQEGATNRVQYGSNSMVSKIEDSIDEQDEISYEDGESITYGLDETNIKTPSAKNTSKSKGNQLNFGSFDEPHLQSEIDQPINLMNQISEDEPTQGGSYDTQSLADMEEGTSVYEKEYVDDYPRNEGDINCCWVPGLPRNFSQLGMRTRDWFYLNKLQLLSGFTVSFTQIAEAVSFAVIAGVDPVLAIQSAFIMGVITTIIGGRPGMVSGVSTMTALALADVVKEHGVEYIFYTVALAGIIQLAFGALGLGVIVRLIPYSVLTGFINSMAVVILFAQLQLFKVVPKDINPSSVSTRKLLEVGYSYQVVVEDEPWAETSVLVVMGLEAALAFGICVIFPRFTKKVSSPFVAIMSTTVFEWILIRQMGYSSPLISDYENITEDVVRKFPVFIFNDDTHILPEINMETFQKICIPAVAIFGSNIVEAIMTKTYLDERIGQKGHTNRMIMGQGVAQIFSGILGGIGGGARLSQSMVNNVCGGYTNLSVVVANLSLFVIVLGASPVVGSTALGGIAGVMFYVVSNLVQMDSFVKMLSSLFPQTVRDRLNLNYKVQRSESLIVVTVFLLTVFIDVGIAVIVGITMSVYLYAWDSGDRIIILREIDADEQTVTYYISGHIFFATKAICLQTFSDEIIAQDPNDVIINLEGAEIFDWSGMLALRTLHDKLVESGKVVAFSSLSASSRRLMEKCSSMWEGINFLFIEEITEDDAKTVAGSTSYGGSTVGGRGTYGGKSRSLKQHGTEAASVLTDTDTI